MAPTTGLRAAVHVTNHADAAQQHQQRSIIVRPAERVLGRRRAARRFASQAAGAVGRWRSEVPLRSVGQYARLQLSNASSLRYTAHRRSSPYLSSFGANRRQRNTNRFSEVQLGRSHVLSVFRRRVVLSFSSTAVDALTNSKLQRLLLAYNAYMQSVVYIDEKQFIARSRYNRPPHLGI